MKIIYNKYLPFKGFSAINLFGVLFVRIPEKEITPSLLRHEEIHTRQIRELGFIPFYILYVLEWIFHLFTPGNAYRKISFEREAYRYQDDPQYLNHRRRFAHWRDRSI